MADPLLPADGLRVRVPDRLPRPLAPLRRFVGDVALDVESAFEGDGHVGFAGSVRRSAELTFDWDGSAISNVRGRERLTRRYDG